MTTAREDSASSCHKDMPIAGEDRRIGSIAPKKLSDPRLAHHPNHPEAPVARPAAVRAVAFAEPLQDEPPEPGSGRRIPTDGPDRLDAGLEAYTSLVPEPPFSVRRISASLSPARRTGRTVQIRFGRSKLPTKRTSLFMRKARSTSERTRGVAVSVNARTGAVTESLSAPMAWYAGRKSPPHRDAVGLVHGDEGDH